MICSILLFALAQQTVGQLVQSDPAPFDEFGSAVDIDGDVAVVGAHSKPINGNNFAGAVYVYRRTAGVWSQEAKLTAPNPEVHDNFGTSVAIQGDVLVVGAPDFPVSSFNGTGRAWVFRKVAGVWGVEQELVPSQASQDAGSGRAVALDGNTIIVNTAALPRLSPTLATVWDFNGTTWSQTDSILSPAGTLFAQVLQLQGERLAIGSPVEDEAGLPAVGAVYLYERQAGVWNIIQRFTAPMPTDSELFGTGFDFEGDLFVAGAPNVDFQGEQASGVVYVFRETAGTWQLEAELLTSRPQTFASFGDIISVDGGRFLAASSTISSGSPVDSGAGYLFQKFGQQWAGGDAMYDENGSRFQGMGLSSAMSGSTALFGTFQGKVIVFDLDSGFRLHGPAPSSQLKADNFNTMQVSGAAPSQNIWLAMSLSGFGTTHVGGLGVTLNLNGPSQFGAQEVADANGKASWTFFVPSGAEDRTAWWQAIQVGSLSNGIATFIR